MVERFLGTCGFVFLVLALAMTGTVAISPAQAFKIDKITMNESEVVDAINSASEKLNELSENKNLNEEEIRRKEVKKLLDDKIIKPAKEFGKKNLKEKAKNLFEKCVKTKKCGKIAKKTGKIVKKVAKANPKIRAVMNAWNLGTKVGGVAYRHVVGPLIDRHFEKKKQKQEADIQRWMRDHEERVMKAKKEEESGRKLEAGVARIEAEITGMHIEKKTAESVSVSHRSDETPRKSHTEDVHVGYRADDRGSARPDNGYRDRTLDDTATSANPWGDYEIVRDVKENKEVKAAREEAAAETTSPSTYPSSSQNSTFEDSQGSAVCESPPAVYDAIKQAEERGTGGGVSGAYCGMANVYGIMIGEAQRCLEERTLNVAAENTLRSQLATFRQNLATSLQGFRAGSSGTCSCWSRFCSGM